MISKSQIILFIYDELTSKRVIKTNDIIFKYNISSRTFRRYIAETNAYLYNNYKNECIIYNSDEKCYTLKNTNY